MVFLCANENKKEDKKENIVEFSMRKGLFFPSAEIYSTYSGFFDYGPYGRKIREKMVSLWRKMLVEEEGFLEIDGATILPEEVFVASGHLENFNDPIIQCKKCGKFYRADKYLNSLLNLDLKENTPLEEFDALIKENGIKCECGGEFYGAKKFNLMFEVDVGPTGKQKAY